MEILSARVFPQMVEDAAHFDHHHHQQQLDSSFSLDDEFDSFHPHFPSEPCSYSSRAYPVPLVRPETVPSFATRSVGTTRALTKRPRKQLKIKSWNSPGAPEQEMMARNVVMSPSPSAPPSPSPDSHLMAFGNPDSSPAISDPIYGTYEIQDCEGPKVKNAGSTSRKLEHAQEHVLAERKRREKISERLIALSAIIPNLKKMDKASILEDAIKYLKELQQHVQVLEEEAAAKTVESVVLVKKSRLTTAGDTYSSTDGHSCGQVDRQLSLPEIEARVSGTCVLVKIHCEKRTGSITKMIGKIEKLNLTVVNSCVMPFGSSIQDVTILALMDMGFSLKTGDLVRNLRQVLLDLI
ncbi:transcription factor bHLH18-like [Rhodamnia argentea]|uniref:Transcription factor bHLH18-like n=1 Tax=Rhodamnia argentea TaxID=178133 RepID=A0A8B8QPX4_9MYRT|nr:transcription factor bHLH18-like [Rhodamnia argentea]